MTIKSSVFSPVYNTNPITNNLLVEMVNTDPNNSGGILPPSDINAISSNTTFINSSITSVVLLEANPNRVFAAFKNKSTSTAYIQLASISTTDSPYEIEPNGFMSFDKYTGPVSCIWDTANGKMNISEATK